MDVQVTYDGPLFDGRAVKEIDEAMNDMSQDAGELGLQMLHQAFGETLRHPTGRYERNLTYDLIPDGVDLNDGDSVYGPWLEGVGSRNSRSSFKGYSNFRRTMQRLQDRIDEIAEAALQKHIGRMN